ncbi:TBC1 domain family member 30-like [Ruditapes philippinarum]|uniref:TBC1 domain family member 30-like n=1 Tax=Ruditapes philippinarum TaxID=129788 RepID=UPI00295B6940|nr:TBC1 domain family member 30-like [Ruditapes philippinarum]
MADADSDLENNFPINIYSPIDPRFNNYNANYRQNVNESRDQTVTSENSIISGSYPYDTRFSSTDVDFSKSPYDRQRLDSQSSIVDGLLSEIYDRWHDHRHDSFDSDTFTECSSTSEFMHWRRHSVHLKIAGRSLGHLHRGILQDYGLKDLRSLLTDISRHVSQMSARLVRQLKRRERRMSKLQNNCDIVTAIIQASSPKRRK